MSTPPPAICLLLQAELSDKGDIRSYLQSVGMEVGCGGATGSVGMGGGR